MNILEPEALARSDGEIAKTVGEVLGMELPEACVPGVAGNVRLLAYHLAILRGQGDTPEDAQGDIGR